MNLKIALARERQVAVFHTESLRVGNAASCIEPHRCAVRESDLRCSALWSLYNDLCKRFLDVVLSHLVEQIRACAHNDSHNGSIAQSLDHAAANSSYDAERTCRFFVRVSLVISILLSTVVLALGFCHTSQKQLKGFLTIINSQRVDIGCSLPYTHKLLIETLVCRRSSLPLLQPLGFFGCERVAKLCGYKKI